MKTALLSLLMTLGFNVAHAGPVEITTTPTNPIVFNNDFTTQDPAGNPILVKGPWFSFTVHMNNLMSTDALTIIGLHVEVTGQDANGNPVTNIKDIVPASFNYSNMGLTCQYADFGSFDAGSTTGASEGNLHLTPSGTAGCMAGDIVFYVDGNPAVQNTSSIVYSVKVQPIGFIGTPGAPKGRFDDFITISTQ